MIEDINQLVLEALEKDDVTWIKEFISDNGPNEFFFDKTVVDIPFPISHHCPLICAILYFKANACFDHIIKTDVNINAGDFLWKSSTFFATTFGTKEQLEKLFAKGANLEKTDFQGRTIAHYAIEAGDIEKLRLILANGCKINEADSTGQTLLHIAAAGNQLEIAKLLIENGADLKADIKGRTPIVRAVEHDSIDVFKLFSEHYDPSLFEEIDKTGKNLFHIAAINKSYRCAVEIHKKFPGIDINKKDMLGWAPILYAAENNSKNFILKLSKSKRIDLKTTNNDGKTALHIAAENGCRSALLQLIAIGADKNAVDANGNTPLHWAAMRGRQNTVEKLLESRANPSVPNNEGKCASELAWGSYSGDIRSLFERALQDPNKCSIQ